MFIEEAFERLLLDYDRVFSAMAIPACLWRRTGEIYKANREFAELVGVDGYMLRDVRSHPHAIDPMGALTVAIAGPSMHLRAHGGGLGCELLGGMHHDWSRWLPALTLVYAAEIRQCRVRLKSEGSSHVVCAPVQAIPTVVGRDDALAQVDADATKRRRLHQLLLLVHDPEGPVWDPDADCGQLYQMLTMTVRAVYLSVLLLVCWYKV